MVRNYFFIAGSLSLALHVGAGAVCLNCGWSDNAKRAEVLFEPGESAIELTLSAPSRESKAEPAPPKPEHVLRDSPPATRTTVAPKSAITCSSFAVLQQDGEPEDLALPVAEKRSPTRQRVHDRASPPLPKSPSVSSAAGDDQRKGVKSGASVAECPRPVYPLKSRDEGERGVVIFQVEVDATGKPVKIELETSSGFPRLDRAALEAVRRARFHPATSDGKPVPSVRPMKFIFRLEES